MTSFHINLNSIDSVRSFVNMIGKYTFDADIQSDNLRYIIDAKSIMGIFSLDLSKNLTLVVHADSNDLGDFSEAIKPYLIE